MAYLIIYTLQVKMKSEREHLWYQTNRWSNDDIIDKLFSLPKKDMIVNVTLWKKKYNTEECRDMLRKLIDQNALFRHDPESEFDDVVHDYDHDEVQEWNKKLGYI